MPVSKWSIRYSASFSCHLIVAENEVVVPMRFATLTTAGVWASAFRNRPTSYTPILFDVDVKVANAPFTPDDEAEKAIRSSWEVFHNKWMLYLPAYFMHQMGFRIREVTGKAFDLNSFTDFYEARNLAGKLGNVTPTILPKNAVRDNRRVKV